jgi:hypothetical protein
VGVFAVAFILQGMSLTVFRSDRPAQRVGPLLSPVSETNCKILCGKIFTVTSTADEGPGSLREAILAANASEGFDEIRFGFTEPVTITLASALPDITDAVSIESTSPPYTGTAPVRPTVDGSQVFEPTLEAVFVISGTERVRLSGMRLVNPHGYGAKVSGGTSGTVIISNTVIGGYGGVQLVNTGEFTVTDNAFLDLDGPAVMAEKSNSALFEQNVVRNAPSAFRLLEGVKDVTIISNTVFGNGESTLRAIELESTEHVTVTSNTLIYLVDVGVQVQGAVHTWMQENRIQDIGGVGIRLTAGVEDAVIISNTIGPIFDAAGAGILAVGAAGTVSPTTGVAMRGNVFRETATPIVLGEGVNNDFPAPELLEAFVAITGTATINFSAKSDADPNVFAYPLLLDVYRVRDGSYSPLQVSVPYDPVSYQDPISYTVTVSDVVANDQLALIATTANPSTSQFSPPVPLSQPVDSDTDGIDDTADLCPGTVIPESVPSEKLGVNRFALVDGDFDFDTTLPEGVGPIRAYSTMDTGGCSCEQIVDELDLGIGHVRFGCSISAMDEWVAQVSASKQDPRLEADKERDQPQEYVLAQNYPNPFNPSTVITFGLPEDGHVSLVVFDVLGRTVHTLLDRELGSGTHQVEWNGLDAHGRSVASGIYLYRLEAGDFSQERVMILLR